MLHGFAFAGIFLLNIESLFVLCNHRKSDKGSVGRNFRLRITDNCNACEMDPIGPENINSRRRQNYTRREHHDLKDTGIHKDPPVVFLSRTGEANALAQKDLAAGTK